MKPPTHPRAQWIGLLIHVAAAYFKVSPADVYQPQGRNNPAVSIARKLLFYWLIESGMSEDDAGRALCRSGTTAHKSWRYAKRNLIEEHPVLLSRFSAVPR